jgi:hypothetical protein
MHALHPVPFINLTKRTDGFQLDPVLARSSSCFPFKNAPLAIASEPNVHQPVSHNTLGVLIDHLPFTNHPSRQPTFL